MAQSAKRSNEPINPLAARIGGSKTSNVSNRNGKPVGKGEGSRVVSAPANLQANSLFNRIGKAGSKSSSKKAEGGKSLSKNSLFMAINGTRPTGIQKAAVKVADRPKSISSSLLTGKSSSSGNPAKAQNSEDRNEKRGISTTSSKNSNSSLQVPTGPASLSQGNSKKPRANGSAPASSKSERTSGNNSQSGSNSGPARRSSPSRRSPPHRSPPRRSNPDRRSSPAPRRSNPRRSSPPPRKSTRAERRSSPSPDQSITDSLDNQPQSIIRTVQSRPDPVSFSIKDSSRPLLLLLRNLETGTSSDDVSVFVKSIGPVLECRALDEANGSVTSEVLFEYKEDAMRAAKKLNGSLADGRILNATVTTTQTIPDRSAKENPYPARSARAVYVPQPWPEYRPDPYVRPVVDGYPSSAVPSLYSDAVYEQRKNVRPAIRQ